MDYSTTKDNYSEFTLTGITEMIEKLFDAIGHAYVENKNKYPDHFSMNHTTYGMIMYNKVPEHMSRKSLDRDNKTIFGIPVIFDEKLGDNQIKLLYCKKSIN